jgi:hypothetical protein
MLGAATSPARADLLVLASLGTLPFGPFTPTEDIVVTGSIVNVSNQDVTICEGICGGVNSTYELGGFAGAQTGYTFSFGDGSDPSAGFLDGEASGVYAPGQEKSFIFGEYIPDGGRAAPGVYNFGTQLQIFAATPGRPMVGSSSFSGTFQVAAAPEPSTWAMMLVGFVGLGFVGSPNGELAMTGARAPRAWPPCTAASTWLSPLVRNGAGPFPHPTPEHGGGRADKRQSLILLKPKTRLKLAETPEML